MGIGALFGACLKTSVGDKGDLGEEDGDEVCDEEEEEEEPRFLKGVEQGFNGVGRIPSPD